MGDGISLQMFPRCPFMLTWSVVFTLLQDLNKPHLKCLSLRENAGVLVISCYINNEESGESIL